MERIAMIAMSCTARFSANWPAVRELLLHEFDMHTEPGNGIDRENNLIWLHTETNLGIGIANGLASVLTACRNMRVGLIYLLISPPQAGLFCMPITNAIKLSIATRPCGPSMAASVEV